MGVDEDDGTDNKANYTAATGVGCLGHSAQAHTLTLQGCPFCSVH